MQETVSYGDVMSEENKKIVRMEALQNWTAFGLMAIGAGLAIAMIPLSLYVIGAGLMLGLFFILKRTLPKKPTILTIIATLSGLYLPVSFWLLIVLPDFYGEGLGALLPWSISLLVAGIVAIASMTIELFRISKAGSIPKGLV
jgi:hypothetical protein